MLEGLKLAWAGFWTFLEGLLGTILGVFRGWFLSVIFLVGGFIESFVEFFKNLYKELIGQSIIPDMLSDIWTAFTDTFSDLLTGLGEWIVDVIDFFKDLVSGIIGPEGVVTQFGKDLITNITTALDDAITEGGKKWLDFKNMGINLFGSLVAGIKDKVLALKNAVTGGIKDAIQAGKEALGIESPSKEFKYMAEMSVKGWTNKWDEQTPKLERQMAMNVAPALMMGGPSAPMATSNNYSSIDQSTKLGDQNISMPVTVIDSQISLAQFKTTLRDVLTERG